MTVPGKRERVLLSYLALSPSFRQPRRSLVRLLWDEASADTPLANLRVCVWRLRKALGDAEHRIIASQGEDIVLDGKAFETDVPVFRALAASNCKTDLEQAVTFCGRKFLDGLDLEGDEFESWLREETARYDYLSLDVLSRLMTHCAEKGETAPAIETGTRIIRLDPLHEPAVRCLMRLHAAAGQRGSAIHIYRTLEAALKTELDAEPEAETRTVFEEITRGEGYPTFSPTPAIAAYQPMPTAQTHDSAGAQLQTGQPIPLARFRHWMAGFPLMRRRTIAWAAVAGLTATLAIFQLVPGASTTTQTGVDAEKAAASSPASAISIVVLPFANLSGDAEQKFFSDGITEEITSALARVRGLTVLGRSSAFQFERPDRDLRDIGKALGAAYLIEGSVRKAGPRVLITAQLIRAENGAHLWAEIYDRELTDVFAIQEDIATHIAGALSIPLGLSPGQRLVPSRIIDPESYREYLRARPLVRARSTGVPEAIAILEPLLAKNPEYAPAWALLASAYSTMPTYVGGSKVGERIETFWPEAEAAAQRAIELDPTLSDAYFALARLERLRGKLLEAEDLLSKALALDPNNPDALGLYMLHLANVGREKEALAAAQQLRALEPYVPTFNEDAAEIFWENGRNDTAIRIRESLIERPAGPITLAMMYASTGRYAAAADLLEDAARNRSDMRATPLQYYAAAGLLRTAPVKAVLSQTAPRLDLIGFAYLYAATPERVLELYEDTIKSGLVGIPGGRVGFLWHPSYASVRKTERFKALMRSAGLVDYWRAQGWPELCHPTRGDDFVCQ